MRLGSVIYVLLTTFCLYMFCRIQMLKRHFSHESYYLQLMELFHDVTYRTELGQLLDLTSQPMDKPSELARYVGFVVGFFLSWYVYIYTSSCNRWVACGFESLYRTLIAFSLCSIFRGVVWLNVRAEARFLLTLTHGIVSELVLSHSKIIYSFVYFGP